MKLKNAQGVIIKTFNPDFGKGFEYSFSTKTYSFALTTKDNELNSTIRIYPNPAHDKFHINMQNTENAIVAQTILCGELCKGS